MRSTDAAKLFAALAQETRVSVLRLLVEAGPAGLAAGKLSEALQMAHNSMSFHLAQLKACGLIRAQKQGRSIFYQANFDQITALIDFLVEDCCATSDADCSPSCTAVSRDKQPSDNEKPRLKFNWSEAS